MTNPILAPELLELIDSGDFVKLREVVEAVHPAETADFVAALNDADIWRFLAAVSQQQAVCRHRQATAGRLSNPRRFARLRPTTDSMRLG